MRSTIAKSFACGGSALLLLTAVNLPTGAQVPETPAAPATPTVEQRPVRLQRWSGKITVLDAAAKTVTFVRTGIKSNRPFTTNATGNFELRQVERNLHATVLKVGDTLSAFWTLRKPDEDHKGVFIEFGRHNSEWNTADVTAIKPLTIQIDGKAMKLRLSVWGDDYAFDWTRTDAEHNTTTYPFIRGIDQQTLTRKLLNPITFEFNIPSVAILTTTNSKVAPNSWIPQLLDEAVTATVAFQQPQKLTFTRVAPMAFSSLQVGQSIIAEVEVQETQAERIVTVKRITLDLTPRQDGVA